VQGIYGPGSNVVECAADVLRLLGHNMPPVGMFKKILIANRGEIACRVIKTARRMGIKTVAVYSDADAYARLSCRWLTKLSIGPSPAAQSYLIATRSSRAVMQADVAVYSDAEAVHPKGYGFLSVRIAACAPALPKRWRQRASSSSARR
jgi:propionyl-CoA carboxylase alpha chain